MNERKPYYDGENPDQVRSAWTVTNCVLGAIFAAAIGCAVTPPPVVGPTNALDVLTCGDSEVTVNGLPKRPDADNVARFAVTDASLHPLTVLYKAPGDAVGLTQAFTLDAGAHQVLIGDCRPLTAPGFQVRFVLPFTPLPRLVANGFWVEAGGKPWFGFQTSEYSLYELWLTDKAAFQAAVDDRKGANDARVWLLYDVDFSQPFGGHARLIPSEHANFYTELAPFAREMAKNGRYVEFTAFTGAKRLMPNCADQQAHLDKLLEVQRTETNIRIEMGNEFEQGDNQWCTNLVVPDGALVSEGSAGSDRWPINVGLTRMLAYGLMHENDAPEWWRKESHEALEMAGRQRRPTFTNETTKAEDDRDPQRWYGAFQGCKLLINGCTFHSRVGRFSKVFPPDIKALFLMALEGANSLPMDAQRAGDYAHRDDMENWKIIQVDGQWVPNPHYNPSLPSWLRVYQRGGYYAFLPGAPE